MLPLVPASLTPDLSAAGGHPTRKSAAATTTTTRERIEANVADSYVGNPCAEGEAEHAGHQRGDEHRDRRQRDDGEQLDDRTNGAGDAITKAQMIAPTQTRVRSLELVDAASQRRRRITKGRHVEDGEPRSRSDRLTNQRNFSIDLAISESGAPSAIFSSATRSFPRRVDFSALSLCGEEHAKPSIGCRLEPATMKSACDLGRSAVHDQRIRIDDESNDFVRGQPALMDDVAFEALPALCIGHHRKCSQGRARPPFGSICGKLRLFREA